MLPHSPYAMHDESSSPPAAKPRNACDECRSRKLKCSGELTGCSRCTADRVACRYSPRKQMGRPRKKRNGEEVQQDYEPWTLDSTTGGIEAPISQPDSNVVFADTNPQMPSTCGYNRSGGTPIGSPSLDYGFNNMGISYLDPSPSQANGIPPMDMPIDFSNLSFPASPNFSNDYPWATSGANYTFSPSPSHQPPPSLPTPPIISPTPRSPSRPCTCLPHLYKTLQLLPNYTATPTFPLVLPPLRRATQTARQLLACPLCPTTYASALQNSMGAVTLLNLIITTYHKLLLHVDARAKSSSSKIKFRFGEMTQNGEGHSGTLDCPMGIEVDLSGAEWRTLARKAVRRDVLGEEEEAGQGSLMGVLGGMRARQREWHGSRRFVDDMQHQQQHDVHGRDAEGGRENCICVQGLYLEQMVRQVLGLGL